MAVYTHVSAEMAAEFLKKYDAGNLVTLKGIAEGVENSNYFVETTKSRFILTLYEKRVDPNDLPFFYAMLDHLHKAGGKVPRFITDKNGQWLQEIGGRPACLIEFLSGVSVTEPNAAQSRATGAALGQLHSALSDFSQERPNSLGIKALRPLAHKCGADALNDISDGLAKRIEDECDFLEHHWPDHLPRSTIHADLFPDNVLMRGDEVSGLIDFYFACTDVRAYDLAITHAAWSFSDDGAQYREDIGQSLLAGYENAFGFDQPTRDNFSILARAASLRFLLTRCFDWINTPADALVTRKEPTAFLKRLDFYTAHADDLFPKR